MFDQVGAGVASTQSTSNSISDPNFSVPLPAIHPSGGGRLLETNKIFDKRVLVLCYSRWVFCNHFVCDALFGSCAMALRLADRVHCPSLGSRWGILLYVPQLLVVLSALYAVFDLDMPSFSKAFKGMRTFFFDGRGILGEREILWSNSFYK